MTNKQIENNIETLKEQLGVETLLAELISALNNDELTENIEHISAMWDIEID